MFTAHTVDLIARKGVFHLTQISGLLNRKVHYKHLFPLWKGGCLKGMATPWRFYCIFTAHMVDLRARKEMFHLTLLSGLLNRKVYYKHLSPPWRKGPSEHLYVWVDPLTHSCSEILTKCCLDLSYF